MMTRKILFFISICLTCLACENNEWDKHYDQDNQLVSDQTVLQTAEKTSDVSEFVSLIKELDLQNRLNTKEIVTLFAPKNGTFDVSTMSEEEKMLFVKNHIVATRVILDNIKEVNRFKALSSKYIRVDKGEPEHVINEEIKVLQNKGLLANGVVLVIDKPIPIEENVYDFIKSLGDEYSIVRDTVTNNEKQFFDKDNSLVIGMDDLGNLVYDSVFVTKNPFFGELGQLNDESKKFSVIVPSDEQYLASREVAFDYFYNTLGRYPTKEDTLTAQNIIFSLMGYTEEIDIASPLDEYFSNAELKWLTAKQGNFINSISKSNGSVITVDKIHLPLYLYMEPIIYYSPIYFNDLMTEELKSESFVFGEMVNLEEPLKLWDVNNGGATTVTFVEDIDWATVNLPDEQDKYGFSWLPLKEITKNGERSIITQTVPPGIYEVTFSSRNWRQGNVQVLINGKEIGEPTGRWGSPTNWTDFTLGYYEHSEDDPETVMASAFLAGLNWVGWGRVAPHRIRLVPTENNY